MTNELSALTTNQCDILIHLVYAGGLLTGMLIMKMDGGEYAYPTRALDNFVVRVFGYRVYSALLGLRSRIIGTVSRLYREVKAEMENESGSQPIDHDDFCEHGISFDKVCPHCSTPSPKQDEQVDPDHYDLPLILSQYRELQAQLSAERKRVDEAIAVLQVPSHLTEVEFQKKKAISILTAKEEHP